MSSVTLPSIPRITAPALHALLSPTPSPTTPQTATSLTSRVPPNIAIIDVRDDDHIGGHIRGSTWAASSKLDVLMPELLRTLRDKEVVVFHCALSQVRGPKAAVRYARERSESEGKGEKDGAKEQKVCILAEGFSGWQAKYGSDESVTEAYDKDYWESEGL